MTKRQEGNKRSNDTAEAMRRALEQGATESSTTASSQASQAAGGPSDEEPSSTIADMGIGVVAPHGTTASIITSRFPDMEIISFADLDTGTGRFVTEFSELLGKYYRGVDGIGVERSKSLTRQAIENGHSVVQANPEIEGSYERANLQPGSQEIVTINNIYWAPGPLVAQADRILKPNGMLIIVFNLNDIFEEERDC